SPTSPIYPAEDLSQVYPNEELLALFLDEVLVVLTHQPSMKEDQVVLVVVVQQIPSLEEGICL
ncbi:hypothetical protein L195_g064542, partial [Trifolium pratense]